MGKDSHSSLDPDPFKASARLVVPLDSNSSSTVLRTTLVASSGVRFESLFCNHLFSSQPKPSFPHRRIFLPSKFVPFVHLFLHPLLAANSFQPFP